MRSGGARGPADDAFMYYAVVHGKVGAEGLRLAETLAHIETLDYRERGRRGVALFYRRAHEAGLIPRLPRPDFVCG